MDLLPLIPTGASRVHGNSVLTWASSGSGDSGPYLGIIGTWFHCMTCRLASPGPVNSGPYLGIIGTWFH